MARVRMKMPVILLLFVTVNFFHHLLNCPFLNFHDSTALFYCALHTQQQQRHLLHSLPPGHFLSSNHSSCAAQIYIYIFVTHSIVVAHSVIAHSIFAIIVRCFAVSPSSCWIFHCCPVLFFHFVSDCPSFIVDRPSIPSWFIHRFHCGSSIHSINQSLESLLNNQCAQ
jgi:hypothetical protein